MEMKKLGECPAGHEKSLKVLNTAIMNTRDWLDIKIEDLIVKAGNSEFQSTITEQKILKAKELIKMNAHSSIDFFMILTSINLLNASIKRAEYKKRLTYSEIKGHTSRIIHYLITLEFNKYDIDFYINPMELCAYIEIYNLQFSFHNIRINDTIKAFIDSERNKLKDWRGIRLQKIAGELFDLSIEYRDINQ